MNFLFVHQNFPGQFRHIARSLAGMSRHRVVGIGETVNLEGRPSVHPAITVVGYRLKQGAGEGTHHYIRDFEAAIRRGQEVARIVIELKKKGFFPDVVVSHPAWGESLFIRDIFPDARHVNYFEYYYRSSGGDVGFDPEFPSTFDDRFRIRIKNSTQLHALESADAGISPTCWQRSLYPDEYLQKIRIIHEGIDTGMIVPDTEASVELEGHVFRHGDKVITYVSRNLEPYRGFHVFMRSLPLIQERCPDARIIIVGGEGVSYGRKLPEGKTYRSIYREELQGRVDWSKVHFTGRLPYNKYISILQLSSVHVYLTYPFVLSWSMLEAMSAGCVVVGSATAPVEEVIRHGENGLLTDFFDTERLAVTVGEVVAKPSQYDEIRKAARKTIIDRYDLKTLCLPEMLNYLTA